MNIVSSQPSRDIKNLSSSVKARIGCSTLTFKSSSLIEALDRIAAEGFRAIDIGIIPCHCCHIEPVGWTERDNLLLLDELNSRQLRLSSLNVSLNSFPARYDAEPWEYLEKCVKIAAQLGAYTVTIPPGPPTNEKHWVEAANTITKHFRKLADFAEDSGMRISIEAPHAFTLAEDYAQAARLFEIANDPRLGCAFDTSHAQRDDRYSISEGTNRVGAEIVHVHLRDTLWKNIDLTPGKGQCDYLPFIRTLLDRGYQGDFNFELEDNKANNDHIAQELKFAKKYLHHILDGEQLPPDFEAWKSKRRQLVEMAVRSLRDPKSFVVNRSSLKTKLKPIANLLRQTLPKRSTRFEVRWQKHWTIKRVNRIEFVQGPPPSLSAGQRIIRVGILGCGGVGDNMHAPGFARLPGVQVVGVCDKQHELADDTARRIGCRPFYSLNEMVEQAKPTLVANCTKEWVHYNTTMYLLEHGIDVFCEKIMAEEEAKGEAMVRRAAEKGRVLAVNFNWRFLPGIQKIKQIKESGGLGELCILRFFCHSWVWHHAIDLVGHLGGGIASVSAFLRQDSPDRDHRPWRRFADKIPYVPGICGMAMLETAQGIAANITSSELWNPETCLFNLDAVFRRGVISLSGIRMSDAVGILSSDQNHLNLRDDLVPRDGTSRFAITFQRSIEAFVKAYAKGDEIPSSGKDGLRAMRVEKAIMQSAASGRKIQIAP